MKFDFIYPLDGLVQSAILEPKLIQLAFFSTLANLKTIKSIKNCTFELGTSIYFEKV